MKKILFLILVLALGLSGCAKNEGPMAAYRVRSGGAWDYNVDYIERFKPTLNTMFGENWSITSKQRLRGQAEPITPDTDTSPYDYTKWMIAYKDGDGHERTFEMTNHHPLQARIERYIESSFSYASDYKSLFFDVYLTDLPLDGGNYVACSLVDVALYDADLPENQSRVQAIKAYREALATPKGAVPLHQITSANLFTLCPVYLYIEVTLNDKTLPKLEKEEVERRCKQKVEEMIEAMNAFTGNTLNAEVRVSAGSDGTLLYNGKREWIYEIVGGRIDLRYTYNTQFEQELFDRYAGKFW